MADFTPAPIRYRVWDGKRMHYPDDGEGFDVRDDLTIHPDGSQATHIEGITAFVPLLSTGLHDAEGREVFEGDTFFDVAGMDDVHVAMNTERAQWWLYYADGRSWGPLSDLLGPDFASQPGRIVGNVYEDA